MSSLLDLIETLWNVKIVHLDSFVLRDFGFNRDIVEGKEKSGALWNGKTVMIIIVCRNV